jgi:phage/plasmid-associated DNA primase
MKIMIYGNNKPTLRGNSQAMRNRMRLMVFDYIFKGEGDDRKAQDRLRNEHGDAVLNWMIKGYQDFCKHGLPEPEKIRVATDDYFHEFDKLRGYFDENFIPDDEGEIVFSELYDEVTDFLGWKMSKRKFSETLKHDLEIEVVAGRGNVRVIRGWRKPGLHDIRDEDGTFIPF